MQIRHNAFTVPGGDTIQMKKTKEFLEKKGVQVDVSLDLSPNLSGYDLVHVFNLTRVQETFFQVKNAKGQNKPVVLSTIYWPNEEFEKKAGVGLRGLAGKVLDVDHTESLKATAKYYLLKEKDSGTKYLMHHSYKGMQKYILENSDVFLPNALSEMIEIEKHLSFKADESRVVVVPNAVDTEAVENAFHTDTMKFEKYKGWIVCVGRIDARKNQLSLIKAVKNTGYHLLLIGRESPGQKTYFKKVMQVLKKQRNIAYIESLPNDEVYQVFKTCRVCVLPSWFETPGLVSLEAAVMGCNIVISPKGTTRDYFGPHAFYCDVQKPESIKEQIDRAYNAPFDSELKKLILEKYTWDEAAKQTLRGYQIATSLKGPRL